MLHTHMQKLNTYSPLLPGLALSETYSNLCDKLRHHHLNFRMYLSNLLHPLLGPTPASIPAYSALLVVSFLGLCSKCCLYWEVCLYSSSMSFESRSSDCKPRAPSASHQPMFLSKLLSKRLGNVPHPAKSFLFWTFFFFH